MGISNATTTLHPGVVGPTAPDIFNDTRGSVLSQSLSNLTYDGNASRFESDNNSLVNGGKFAIGTNVDLSGANSVVLFHFTAQALSHLARWDTVANGGVRCALTSSATDAKEFVISGVDGNPSPEGYVTVCIDPGATADTTHGTPDMSLTDALEIGFKSFSNNRAMYVNLILHQDGPLNCTGGTSGTPDTFATLTAAAPGRTLQEPVGNTFICYLPMSFDDGGSEGHFVETTAKTLIFPNTSSGVTNNAHLRDGTLGMSYKLGHASSVCTIPSGYNYTSGVTRFYFGLEGSLGTGTFSGSVNNATAFAIESAWTVNGTFTNCLQIDLTDMPTITSMAIVNPGTGADAGAILMAAGDTLSNVSGTTATATDHLIELPTAGTYTLDSVTSSGFTDAIYVSASSGTVTINVSGSTIFTDADVVTDGATVTVNNTVTWTLEHTDNTQMPDGTCYRIVDSVDGEIYNTTVSGDSGFSFDDTTLTAGRTLNLYAAYQSGSVVRQGGPWPLTIPSGGGTMSWTANETTVDSVAAEYGIDGSTVTEFSTNYVNVQCDIDDVDGETTHKRAYAWMRHIQSTETGIRNWWGIVTALDAANIVYNGDVVDIQFNNDNAATDNLLFTDEDIYVSKSGGSVNLWGEGITAFAGKVYLAETGVSGLTNSESNQLASISTVESKVDTLDTVADEILENQKARKDLNPTTGKIEWRNAAGTIIREADAYEDVDGTTAYNADSTKVARTDYMTAP